MCRSSLHSYSLHNKIVRAYNYHCVLQTPVEFLDMYEQKAREEKYTILPGEAALGFDAVWALAIALNKTAVMVQSGNVSETGCEGNTDGDLVPLEQFNYSNGLMGCVIQWNLQNTDFQGTSVSLKFSPA